MFVMKKVESLHSVSPPFYLKGTLHLRYTEFFRYFGVMASEGELQGVAKHNYGATCATFHFLHIGLCLLHLLVVSRMYGPWELDDVRKVASELSGRLLPDVRYYAIFYSSHVSTIFLAVSIW